jgi:diguanylate cyclase (GGDEF)-like protein/PAS domain S-box-containing protein
LKTINTYYTNTRALQNTIYKYGLKDSSTLLIQVFTGNNELKFIKQLVEDLKLFFPKSVLIGSTTDGEIMSGKVSTHKTVLSFTYFESTTLKSTIIKHKDSQYQLGTALANELISSNTKLLIAFTDGLNSNGEVFLDGIYSVNKNVIVSGGLAGDNSKFEETYVFTKEDILTNGAVGVSLNSDTLNVYNNYSFNWQEIGKKLTITKVKNNRVYTIDNRTAVETYMYYLGDNILHLLPSIGIEFPLMIIKNGTKIARAITAKHEDGSLSFAGNFDVGDSVYFGYGNPDEILTKADVLLSKVKKRPSETIFVYSCMARRRFMPESIKNEITPLNSIAPTSGFFTYGEFYTSREKHELLNQSMTIISLSETTEIEDTPICLIPTKGIDSGVNALIHLVNISTGEMVEQKTFQMFFDKSPEGILIVENNRFKQGNQKLLSLFEYQDEDEILATSVFKLFPKRQPDGSFTFLKLQRMRQWAMKDGSMQFECQLQKKTGEIFWADIIFTNMIIRDQKILYVAIRDISGRKKMENMLSEQKNRLYQQANYDALTGLANRTLFMSALKHKISQLADDMQTFALMFVDLDHFKQINDSLGHAAGDSVIQITAERLESCLEKDDFVARLGGDEFLVLTTHLEENAIVNKAKSILDTLSQPIVQNHYSFYTSASIGISIYPTDALYAEKLLEYADTAMYEAKEHGGNNYQFYTSMMTDVAYDNLVMERDLNQSIKKGEFEVHFQPQVNLLDGSLIGVEALVRWVHPTMGCISPDKFIPLAEKTGLIVELDLWVMKNAMSQISKWYKEGYNPGILSINMSIKVLEHPELLSKLKMYLELASFKGKWLEIELTETVLMTNPEQCIDTLNQLHDLGMHIAIDDFGTGYSSLSYLKHLPIDKLKIDKSFIDDITTDEDAATITKTIVALANNLHLDVIAEGVETQEQRDFLLSLGCLKAQGYYYSKPLPSSDMEEYLALKG